MRTKSLWIGLYISAQSYEWKWIDGSGLNHISWDASEPDHPSIDKDWCVIAKGSSNSGLWSDKDCDRDKFNYVCEFLL